MCGIFGFTRYIAAPEQIALAINLGMRMTTRGQQSWGTTDGIEVKKDVGSFANAKWHNSHLFKPSTGPMEVLLGHTRASSHGSISKENAHPHTMVSDDAKKMIIGVHNGTVSKDAMEKYNTKNFEVDTQMIYDLLVNGKSTKGITGTGMLVWIEDTAKIRFCRFNSTNLYIANDQYNGGLIWASTKSAVVEGAEQCGISLGPEITFKADTIYEVRAVDGVDTLVEIGPQEFGGTIGTVYVNSTGAEMFEDWGNGVRRSQRGSVVAYSGYGTATTYHATTPSKCLCCGVLRPTPATGLCLLCTEIAMQPDAREWFDGFLFVGNHTPKAVTKQSVENTKAKELLEVVVAESSAQAKQPKNFIAKTLEMFGHIMK